MDTKRFIHERAVVISALTEASTMLSQAYTANCEDQVGFLNEAEALRLHEINIEIINLRNKIWAFQKEAVE